MSERDDFILGVVEDTLDGYEKILSPAAMKQMRAAMLDAFEAHPVLSAIIDENLPRAVPDRSGERPVEGTDATADDDKANEDKAGAKKHG